MIRMRLVLHARAARYWLLMLIAFGVTVAGTRIYLEATGYPQIGSGELHFAHALWGGLLQFIALGVMLTFANRATYAIGAILGGIGAGLFIDEVGKFMTQSNDYFFPFAAPIIYATFLLTAFMYLLVRRRRALSPRGELYFVLEHLKNAVDHDLDAEERSEIVAALNRVIAHPQAGDLGPFSRDLLMLVDRASIVPQPRPNPFLRLWSTLRVLEQQYVSRGLARLVLIATLLISSFGGVIVMVTLVAAAVSSEFAPGIEEIFFSQAFSLTPTSASWMLVHAGLTALIDTVLFAAALLFVVRRDSPAIVLARIALVLQLALGNLLGFYFSQFAMITGTVSTLLLFAFVERYHARYLAHASPAPVALPPAEAASSA